MIHCIGDSHASFFSGQLQMQDPWPARSNDLIPLFRSYRIGPATAHNLRDKEQIICDIINTCVDTEKDAVMFCFGEVDCRVHIRNASTKNNSTLTEAVASTVSNYTNFISYISHRFNVMCYVWNVIAQTNYPTVGIKLGEGLPVVGQPGERNQIARIFNTLVGTKTNNLVDLFDSMVDENGLAKEDIFVDGFHLSQYLMPLVLDFFERIKRD